MAIVIHEIGNNRYAYHHYREGKKVRAEYIAPVDSRGRVRALKVGDGVDRAEIGTTHERLKAIYMKAIRMKEIKDRVKPKPKVVKKVKVVKEVKPKTQKEYQEEILKYTKIYTEIQSKKIAGEHISDKERKEYDKYYKLSRKLTEEYQEKYNRTPEEVGEILEKLGFGKIREVKKEVKIDRRNAEHLKPVQPDEKPKRVMTAKRVEIVELKPKEVKPKIIEFESEKEKDEYMKKLKPGESIEYTYRDNDRIMRGSESYESLQKEKKEKEKYEKERIEQRKKERKQWEKEAEEHEKYLKSPEYKKLKKEQEEEETKKEEERAKKDYEEYMKKRGYGTSKAEEERFIKDNKKRHAKIEEENKKNFKKFAEKYKNYEYLDFKKKDFEEKSALADKEYIEGLEKELSKVDMEYLQDSRISSYPDDPEPFRGKGIPEKRKHILKNPKLISDSIVTYNMYHTKGKTLFDRKERKTPITKEESLKNSKDDLKALEYYVKGHKLVDDKIVER